MTMRLVKNPDILQLVGERKTKQLVVGFAAETRDLEKFAMDKLQRKRCDLLVANDVTLEGAGFGTDTNIVRIFDASGLVEALPMLGKREVASRLLSLIADRLTKGDATGA